MSLVQVRSFLLVLAAGVLVMPAAMRAQEPEPATFRGTVIDRTLGRPVSGARVHFVLSGLVVHTGSDGTFALTALFKLPDTVRVSAIGFDESAVPVAAADSVLKFALEFAPIAMQELVVSANQVERRAAEVVMPMTTMTHEELAATAAPSVDQAVSEIPALQNIANPPSGNNVMIRGIAANKVLILVDGEPAPGAMLETRDLSRLSTVAVDRVEVFKGPLSVLYGSDALGGVVNVVTSAPNGPMTMTALARFGSIGRGEVSGSVSGGGRFGYRIAGGWRQQDRVGGVATLDGTLDRVWDLRSTFRYVAGRIQLRADVNYLSEFQRWPVAVSLDAYGFNNNKGWTTWAQALTEGRSGTWRARVFYQDYDHLYTAARGETPTSGADSLTQVERTLKGQFGWTRQLGSQQLDAGVEVIGNSIVAPEKIAGDQQSDRTFALYVQDGMTFGRFRASVALRGTTNSRWGGALTPSIGAAWEPSPSFRLRASVASGFRGPSFKELGWTFLNPAGGYIIQGNPDLLPEDSWQYSLGTTWAPFRQFVMEAEIYRNNVNNLIDQAMLGLTESGYQIYSPQNIQTAVTQGGEFSARWNAGRFSTSLGYAYLDARDEALDIPLDRRAPHTVRLGVNYLAPGTRALTLNVTGRYISEAPIIGVMPDSKLGVVAYQGELLAWDFLARMNVLKQLQLQVGADNIFNVQPANWQFIVQRQVFIGAAVNVVP